MSYGANRSKGIAAVGDIDARPCNTVPVVLRLVGGDDVN